MSAVHRSLHASRLLELTGSRSTPPVHRLFDNSSYVDPTHPRSVGAEVGASVVGAGAEVGPDDGAPLGVVVPS